MRSLSVEKFDTTLYVMTDGQTFLTDKECHYPLKLRCYSDKHLLSKIYVTELT